MATESEITFKISGSALSFLYYECDKSRMDQVGFLIGEKHSYVTKTISDSEMNGEKNETIINIIASLPVGSPFTFCDNVGRINRIKLKEILGPLEKDVCGWYIFKRNAVLNPLLRGTILHRELMTAMPHVTSQSFALCCIGSDTTISKSTHRYRHVFLLYENRNFEPISVPIVNLGQSQDGGYRTNSATTSTNSSFNNIVSSLNLDITSGGLSIMKALQIPLQEKIMETAVKVQQYDQRAQQLVNEIEELKHNYFTRKQHNQSKTGKMLNESNDSEKKHKINKENENDFNEGNIEEKNEKKEDTDRGDSEEIIFSSKKEKLTTDITGYSKCSEDIIIEESNSPKSVDY
ncbi:BRISC complex subunit FAM175B-like [Lycorma delicatula]|uniref:BRISC complex subunit FAM175B-like n=1 Tax=Lycorma delicatula TaxID=130591 RepID=UPI003F5155DB